MNWQGAEFKIIRYEPGNSISSWYFDKVFHEEPSVFALVGSFDGYGDSHLLGITKFGLFRYSYQDYNCPFGMDGEGRIRIVRGHMGNSKFNAIPRAFHDHGDFDKVFDDYEIKIFKHQTKPTIEVRMGSHWIFSLNTIGLIRYAHVIYSGIAYSGSPSVVRVLKESF